MIVSDAGPIIIFARIGQLSLLRNVTGALLIPDTVYHEIVTKKGGMPGSEDIAQAAWIRRVSIASRSTINALPGALHEGERERVLNAVGCHLHIGGKCYQSRLSGCVLRSLMACCLFHA